MSLQRGLRYAIAVAVVVLAVLWFVIVDAGSHSASDTLRPWLGGLVLLGVAGLGLVLLIERLARWTGR
jgi:hypothetical protein